MLSIFNTFMPKFPGYTTQWCFIKHEYYEAIVPVINGRIPQVLTTWTWMIYQGACSWEDTRFSLFQQPSIICSSSSRGKPLWTSSSLLVCPLMLKFCRSCLGSHIFWDIMGTVFMSCMEESVPHQTPGACLPHQTPGASVSPITPLGPLSLTLFLIPLLPSFLNLRWKDCVVGVTIVASHPKIGCYCAFWPTVAFCKGLSAVKRSLLDELWELLLSVGRRVGI